MNNLVFDPAPFKAWAVAQMESEKDEREAWAQMMKCSAEAEGEEHEEEKPDTLPLGVRYHGHLCGPLDVLAVEEARRQHPEHINGGKLGPPVPVHYFVWARGEAPQRHLTKLGGLPYLTKGTKWPTYGRRKMRFVGQINFMDSRGIVGVPLPGDVLLFFDDPDSGEAKVLWVSMTDEPLVEPKDLPKINVDPDAGWDPAIAPMYGYLHASVEYPFSPEIEDNYEAKEDLFEVVPFADATKIGGVPSWIQDDETQEGIFIGCLTSVQFHQPAWPLLNVEQKIDTIRPSYRDLFPGEGEALMLGDCGSLYAVIDPDGKTRVSSQSC